MGMIEVNGKRISINTGVSIFKRSAFQIAEQIYHDFNRVGITKEFISLHLPRNPLKNGLLAELSWEVNGKKHYYKCDTQDRYVDNLGCISQVIRQDCYAIIKGMKSFGQVMNQFKLGYDEDGPKIKSPREILGIPENMKDMDYISFKYKQLSKTHHPDVGGDAINFKEINDAFIILKQESKQQ